MRTRLFILLLGVCTYAAAQYTPNTRWPYLYENFEQGTVYMGTNQKSEAKLNIHLLGNVLHYVAADGKIMQSNERDVTRVEIGQDAYLYGERQLMKIVAQKQENLLLQLTSADFDSMFSGTGAYGSSLNSSASRDLSSLDLGGLNQPELGKMLQEKNEGREIPTRITYYFLINGRLVEATKGNLEDLAGEQRKEEWKAFVKEKKIKWKKEESLALVLDFFIYK